MIKGAFIFASVVLILPGTVFAGPPAQTGLGGYTAYLAGGNNETAGHVTIGNTKVITAGVGQWTAASARQKT